MPKQKPENKLSDKEQWERFKKAANDCPPRAAPKNLSIDVLRSVSSLMPFLSSAAVT